jgi:hypothetical protein
MGCYTAVEELSDVTELPIPPYLMFNYNKSTTSQSCSIPRDVLNFDDELCSFFIRFQIISPPVRIIYPPPQQL